MRGGETWNRPVLASLVIVLTLAALDQTIASTALPAIADDLQGHRLLSWIFSVYLIASTAVIPLYGRLADRYGTRSTLLFAVGIFVVGSAACGLSRQIEELLLARCLQGLGGGGLMTLTMLAARDIAPQRRIGQVQGMLGSAYGLAALLGPLLGGWLAQEYSWRWAFLLNVPIGLVALAALFWMYRPLAKAATIAVDLIGCGLLAVFLALFLVAARGFGMAHGATVLEAVVAPALAVVVGLLFVWRELLVPGPLLPIHLFRQCVFLLNGLLSACTGVALFSVVVFTPLYWQYAVGMTAVQAGLHMLPLMAAISMSSVVGGKWLANSRQLRAMAVASALLMAGGYIGLAVSVNAANVAGILCALSVLGAGIGLAIPLSMMTVQRVAQPRDQGIATALPIMFRTAGGALGVSFLGAALTQQLEAVRGGMGSVEGVAAAFASASGAIFWMSALPCALVSLSMLAMPRTLPAPQVLIANH